MVRNRIDIVKNTSDDMEVFYEKGMELINLEKPTFVNVKETILVKIDEKEKHANAVEKI